MKAVANAAKRRPIALLREAQRKIHRKPEKTRPVPAAELTAQAGSLLENPFAEQEDLLMERPRPWPE
ncbi:MAG: hypothetical protein GX493_06445 [Firmicutes bacterium]|nr:hypothetical protein [Bacillota bacterium]